MGCRKKAPVSGRPERRRPGQGRLDRRPGGVVGWAIGWTIGWTISWTIGGTLLVVPGARADQLPPPLACLVRYYGIGSQSRSGAYFAVLPDGRTVPFDDGRAKTTEQRLADPDVKDLFAQRYPTGAIAAVTTPDFDPGRVRLDPLFQARYGAPPAASAVVPFELFGTRLRVHRLVLPAFIRVRARLTALVAKEPALHEFLIGVGGTFVVRNIAGTNRRSAHSYGVSLDVNVKRSHYWRWQKPAQPLRWRNHIPQSIVDAFEAEGFIWGGRWYHYDTMHFEYRPELLDPSCYG